MKMENRDWLEIRKSVINAGAMLALGLVSVGVTFHFNQSARSSLQHNRLKLSDIEQQARKARDDLDIVANFKMTFDRYKRRGYIGQERRLSWVSTLQHSAQIAGIPSLQYKIDAQRAYHGAPLESVDEQYVYLRESPMHFSAQLLHEGEFIYLMDNLAEKSEGFYEVRACQMDRSATEIKFDPKIPNIVLECKLNWVTVYTGPEVSESW